jgi:hypothetical protein
MQALTDDFILKELILSNSVAVTSAFMFFAVEILDRFVVNQTVGMDSTCNLMWLNQTDGFVLRVQTYNIALVHLAPDTSTPTSQNHACGH